MKRSLLWAGLSLACILLGLQVWGLESRVAALDARMAQASRTRAGTDAAAGTDAGVAFILQPGDVPEEMANELTRLREDLATLRRATGDGPTHAELNEAADEEDILAAVEARNERIRDTQLQFHRERWVEFRQDGALRFAARHGLDPDQTAGLSELLAQEVDAMVKLMKRPGVLEDPRNAGADWGRALARTDGEVEALLDPAQARSWRLIRKHERETLWPWLAESGTDATDATEATDTSTRDTPAR